MNHHDIYVEEFISNKGPKYLRDEGAELIEQLFPTKSPTRSSPQSSVQIKGLPPYMNKALSNPQYSKRSIKRITSNPEYDVITVNPVVIKNTDSFGSSSSPSFGSNVTTLGQNSSISGDSLQDITTMKALGGLGFSDAGDAATYYDAMSRQIRRLKRNKLKDFQQQTKRRAATVKKEKENEETTTVSKDKKDELRLKKQEFAQRVNRKNLESLKLQEQREKERLNQLEGSPSTKQGSPSIVPSLPLNQITSPNNTSRTNNSIPKPSEPEVHPLKLDDSISPKENARPIPEAKCDVPSPLSDRSSISSISSRSVASKISVRSAGTINTVPTTMDEMEQMKLDEERARDLQKQRYKEQQRYLQALREQYIKRVKEQNIEIPPLCNCGIEDPFDDHAKKCCVNCPFYGNPELYARQLASLLSCLM